jgi:hypothetical protein
MARIFLAVVGAAYIALAIWCVARRDVTANAVGFELIPGSGQSEYFVVYGGLELALGIAFLWPLPREEDTVGALRLCCLIHSCLVVFRTVSLIKFSDIGQTTYILAAVEWLILLSTWLIAWKTQITVPTEE